MRIALLRCTIRTLRVHHLAQGARVLEVSRIPEPTEVTAPTEAKRFGKGAELIKPPAGDLIAAEAMNVYVERLSGAVSAPKRLRAACSDQFGLFSGRSARRCDNKRYASRSNVRNKAKRRSLCAAIQSMQAFVSWVK